MSELQNQSTGIFENFRQLEKELRERLPTDLYDSIREMSPAVDKELHAALKNIEL